MGIVVPRPQMRKAERKGIEEQLKLHAARMAKYEAEGIPRVEASRKAFEDVKAKANKNEAG